MQSGRLPVCQSGREVFPTEDISKNRKQLLGRASLERAGGRQYVFRRSFHMKSLPSGDWKRLFLGAQVLDDFAKQNKVVSVDSGGHVQPDGRIGSKIC